MVNAGFVSEDGTRVTYGDYGEDGDATAYQATFEDGDAIGIFAIKTSETGMMVADGVGVNEGAMVPVAEAYKVKNAKLTFSNGAWTLTYPNGETDAKLAEADLLFAYAPYDVNKVINNDLKEDGKQNDGRPSFIQNTDGWALNKKNNRFFTYKYWVTDFSDNGTTNNFKDNDWMGAVAKVPAENETVTFNMIHMRGMVEVTTDKDVELTELTLSYTGNTFKPYLFTTTTSQKVYRVLTTEYRDGFTVKAKITDNEGNTAITKTYQKSIPASEAGVCSRLNVPYAKLITVSGSNKLKEALTTKYGDNYATDPTLKSLRLAGELSAEDWTTLQGLTKLQKLDMSKLTNTEIPANWMLNATTLRTTLTSLVLPSQLTTIRNHGLTVGAKDPLTKIELPATVEIVEDNVFWHCNNLSVCIPEGSKLKSIGSSAFDGLKAVYTDPENVNVLKIPDGVETISGSAFWGVQQLKKIIFQSKEAPTIGSYAFTNVNATIYVPNKPNYYGKSLFPGKTVIVGPVLTADNYTASAVVTPTTPTTSTNDSGNGDGTPGLCDNDIYTYLHTPWWGNYGDATYGQYIDITLPEGVTMNALTVQYITRKQTGAGSPTKVDIYTNNGGDWAKLIALPKEGETLPTDANRTYNTGKMTASFTKVRFAITESVNGSLLAPNTDSHYTALAELTIGEEVWTEPATTPAQ